jgi:Protein of unknown function (DUF3618)
MAERPDQIEQHIASTRHELGNNLHELEDKVKQATDWRTYYERNPMMMVGLAFGGGVMLATMMGGNRERNAAPVMTPAPRPAGYLTGAIQRNPVSDTWQTLKAALIGLSGAKIRSLLDEALPGFTEHYDRAARTNPGFSQAPLNPQSHG